MELLKVSGISKRERGEQVLQEWSFVQPPLKKIAIAGVSGSGKSTLLKIIAGLTQPDTGEVWFKGVKVKGPNEKLIPGHPGIAYLSQYFELRNSYRVEELLDYANALPAEEAHTLYSVCRINHLLHRRTDQLSGGEKQRIALAGLLTTSPSLLLLDEPFSNLDLLHKNILKSVIRDIGERLQVTCILVSHDPLDTLSWAEEILVMKNGQLLQRGTPEQVYRQPVNAYVAGLFGKYNLIPTAALPGSLQQTMLPGQQLFLRPEQWQLSAVKTPGLCGRVSQVSFVGSAYEIEVLLPEQPVTVSTSNAFLHKGDTVYLVLPPHGLWYLPVSPDASQPV